MCLKRVSVQLVIVVCVGGDERWRGWEGGREEGQEEEEKKKIDRGLLCAGVTPGMAGICYVLG